GRAAARRRRARARPDHPLVDQGAALLDRLDVRGGRALGSLDHVEGHRLVFFQRFVAGHLDIAVMREQVLAAVVRRDEPETLGVVEPLHFSCRHVAFLYLKLRAGSEPRFGHDDQVPELSTLLDYLPCPLYGTT